jgi:hypothetical protein
MACSRRGGFHTADVVFRLAGLLQVWVFGGLAGDCMFTRQMEAFLLNGARE